MLCDKENPQNAPERNTAIGDGPRRSSRSKMIEKQNVDVPKKGIESTKKKAAKKKTQEDNKPALVTFAVPEGVRDVTADEPAVERPDMLQVDSLYPIPRLFSGYNVWGGNQLLRVSVTLPNSVLSIEARSFCCCASLAELSLPAGLHRIGEDAFSRCSSLITLSIPDTVLSIGESAFKGCSALVAVRLSANPCFTTIENSVFDGCASLKTMSLPDGITSIGQLAFASCRSLKHVVLPLSLHTVGPGAFQYCPSLFALTFESANIRETADAGKEEQPQSQLRRLPCPLNVDFLLREKLLSCSGFQVAAVTHTDADSHVWQPFAVSAAVRIQAHARGKLSRSAVLAIITDDDLGAYGRTVRAIVLAAVTPPPVPVAPPVPAVRVPVAPPLRVGTDGRLMGVPTGVTTHAMLKAQLQEARQTQRQTPKPKATNRARLSDREAAAMEAQSQYSYFQALDELTLEIDED